MDTLNIRTNGGKHVTANCAAQFSEVLGTQRHGFAVTRRPNYDRGWSLTHVASGARVCRIHELPMVARISKTAALEAGRNALRLVIEQHTLAVVASKQAAGVDTMKFAERLRIAAECQRIAQEHGAEVEVKPRGISGTDRETLVHVHWRELSASFDIGDVLEPKIMVNFHGAKRDLRESPYVFHDVNPCHRRKATSLFANAATFLEWWPHACEAIEAGRVFEPAAAAVAP